MLISSSHSNGLEKVVLLKCCFTNYGGVIQYNIYDQIVFAYKFFSCLIQIYEGLILHMNNITSYSYM